MTRRRRHARHMVALPSDPRAQAAVLDLMSRGMLATDAVRVWDEMCGAQSHWILFGMAVASLHCEGDEAREWLTTHGLWTTEARTAMR